MKRVNPLTTSVPHHIETSQLICRANQLTAFYMIGDSGSLWLNSKGVSLTLVQRIKVGVNKTQWIMARKIDIR